MRLKPGNRPCDTICRVPERSCRCQILTNRLFFCSQGWCGMAIFETTGGEVMRGKSAGVILLLAGWVVGSGRVAGADPSDPASLLPLGALAALQMNNLGAVVGRLEKSGLVEALYFTPQGIELTKRPDFKKAMAGKAILEQQAGMSAVEILTTILGGQVAVGMYPQAGASQPEFLAVMRVRDPARWKQLRERIEPFLLLADQVMNVSRPANGVTQITVKNVGALAWGDAWLMAGTKADRLPGVWGNLQGVDSGKEKEKKPPFKSLAEDVDYQAIRQQLGGQPVIGFFLSNKVLKSPDGKRLISDKLDNPVASLLLGGLIEMVGRSPYLGGALTVGENDFALRLAAPGEVGKLDAGRKALFPAAGKPGTPRFPAVPGLIGGIAWDRDIATWYTNREALLESRALPGFDQFETGIANILPGKDFATDVLGTLGRGMTVLAAPQDYSYLDGTPGVKLPAFALIIDLAKPKEGASLMNLFLQTLAAILNIEAGQQGRQPWVMTSETHNGVQISFGDYLQKPKGKDLPVVTNFTPAAALVGNRYLLCTSRGLCKQLIDTLAKPSTVEESAATPVQADDWAVTGSRLADALALNRNLLEAGGLRNGRTGKQAREEFQAMEDALRQVEKLRLRSVLQPWGVELRLEGSWK